MSKEPDTLPQFEQMILPHIQAAYNLARWIMSDDQEAEDMVQEAYLRAYQYFDGFQGGSSRSWLLKIVRNTCYTRLRQGQSQGITVELDDEAYASEAESTNPETLLLLRTRDQLVRRALEEISVEFRELIVLRELEGLSYKEIALIAGIPIGTVMSRLARARQQMKRCLLALNNKEGSDGL